MKTPREIAKEAVSLAGTPSTHVEPFNWQYEVETAIEQALTAERIRYDELKAEFKNLQETARCHYAREKQLEAELEEQCKLHGIGSNREHKQLTKIKELEAEVKRLKGNLSCVGIHTCHEQCENPMCLLHKKCEQLEADAEIQKRKRITAEAAANSWRQDFEALSHENLKMRESLSQIIQDCNPHAPRHHTIITEEASAALDLIPHTTQLAKQRDADLAVITAAEDMYNAMTNSMVQAARERLKNALAAREKVYGERK